MRKRILLVEDEAIIAMSTKKMLETNDFEVVTVHNGVKAIAMVDEDPQLSLILMDIDLGKGIDGTEAAQEILRNHDIPIIFHTSHSEKEYVDKVKEITRYGYILKNSGRFVLIEAITMAFELFEAHSEVQEREKRYKSIFYNSHSPMMLIEPETGDIIDVNPAASEFYGWAPEVLSNMKIQDINQLSQEEVFRGMERAKEDERTVFNFRHKLSDGSIRDVEARFSQITIKGKQLLYSIIQDITEKVITEENLKKSEKTLRTTLDSIGDAVISTGSDGKVTRINRAAEKLTGWSGNAAKGKNLNEIFHIINVETREVVENPVEKVLQSGTIVGLANHTALLSNDGQEYQIADSAAPIKDDEGNVNGVVLVFRDVTDQYEKNRQIKRNASLLEETQKLAHIGSWELDLTTYQLSWSDEIYRIFGLRPQEFGATYDAFLDAVYPEDRYKVDEAYADSIRQNQDGYSINHRIVRKDTGEIRYVHEKCIHVRDEDGKIIRSMGMVQDIIEHSWDNKAYQRIFNLTPALICVAEVDGYFKEINLEWEKSLGYTVEELKSRPFIDFIHPDDAELTKNEIEKQIDGSSSVSFINRYRHKNGSYRYLEWNALPSEQGYLYASAKDITGQIDKEEELKKSEEKYRSLFNYSNDAIFVHEIGEGKLPGRIIEVNEQACKLLQYSREELLQMSIKDITPEKNRHIMPSRAKKLIDEKKLTFEANELRRDGSVIPVEVSAYTYSESDKEIVLASVRDITERKSLEKELRSKKELLENIIENMFDLVSLTDLAGNFIFIGKSHEILGYEPTDLIGSNVMELVHPDDFSHVEQKLKNYHLAKENNKIEYRYRCFDGSYLWFETLGKILTDESGKAENMLFSTRDISERKQMERSLKESEKKFRLITENVSDIIVQVDEQLKPIYVSSSISDSLGYTIEDLSDKNVLEFIPPEDQKKLAEIIEEKINKNENRLTHSHRIYTKSGDVRWMELSASLSYDAEGHFVGATYADRDITDIRKLEQLNNERRQLLEALLEAAPNAIITFDSRNKINEWNRGAEELFHYTREEVLGHGIDEIVGGEDDNIYEEALSFSKQTLSGEAVPPTETVRFTKEKEPLSVIVAGSPIIVDDTFTGVVATYTDISRLKQKEKEVETLLVEKEHLLHEVHHRIKNHMSTISSIISLRASHIDNQQSWEVLNEVQHKVNLMQNIYQSLYTGEDVGTILISSYLEPVLHDIQSAYIDSQFISITTDIEEIEVTSKQSLPIGIIITELITNSIKYAFNEGGKGKIHISIYKDKENPDFLCIEVSDSGKGMPFEVVEEGKYGFGLTLVEGYTNQFDGTMSISTEEGTTVRVVLELEGD